MKTLVWGDVHNRTSLLKSFLAKNGDKFDKRIFLGDWFDQWGDKPDHAKKTAECIVELMEDPRNVFLEGNHDTAYRFHNSITWCPGFDWDKHRFISTVMTYAHWEKFKLFEYEQGWLCSHAGAHPVVFSHPITGITVEGIQKECDKAIDCSRSNIYHPVYAMGKASGGVHPTGGITWLRWGELEPIEGLNQIVGHTILNVPQVKYSRKKVGKYKGESFEKTEEVCVDWGQYMDMSPKKERLNSENWNIDTNNRHFAIIENGQVSIQLTLDYL